MVTRPIIKTIVKRDRNLEFSLYIDLLHDEMSFLVFAFFFLIPTIIHMHHSRSVIELGSVKSSNAI